jgi:hypothetical protein
MDDSIAAGLPSLTLTQHTFTVGYWAHADADDLVFDAPYQRESVWDDEARVDLIRSILMGLPIGAVITSTTPQHTHRVIDGRQRLETIRGFVRGAFGVPRNWFHPAQLAAPGGTSPTVTFDDLNAAGRRKFTNLGFASLEFDAYTQMFQDDGGAWQRRERTEDEAIAAEAEVYLLVNFGGVPQTDGDYLRATAVARR